MEFFALTDERWKPIRQGGLENGLFNLIHKVWGENFMKTQTEKRIISKKDALAEALKRHFKISKLGKTLSPDEGNYFLCAIGAMAKGGMLAAV